MRPNEKTYKKQDSFDGIRHKSFLKDISLRILKVRENLSHFPLSSYEKAIVGFACDDLLGGKTLDPDTASFILHSYAIEDIIRLEDKDLPRYLFYRYRYDIFPQRLRLDEFPPCLQIEPASICNYRCPFCYQIDREFTSKKEGMMGMMSLDLFKKLIDQAEGQCEAVTLASRGEPLMCPDIEEMLAYAKDKFLAFKMNTNAWFLNESRCHAILEAGLNTLVFSVDAASEPVYSRLRKGGNLKRVLGNIKLFHSIRLRHYSDSQTITRISGVKVPEAESLDEMEKFWGEWVDQVALVNYNPWENTYERPLHEMETPCSDLWRRMFVWWDGMVNPCDADYKSHLQVGNALDSDLTDLWKSERYTKIREDHVSKKRSKVSPCNRCIVI